MIVKLDHSLTAVTVFVGVITKHYSHIYDYLNM